MCLYTTSRFLNLIFFDILSIVFLSRTFKCTKFNNIEKKNVHVMVINLNHPASNEYFLYVAENKIV